MKKSAIVMISTVILGATSCQKQEEGTSFNYIVDRFADVEVLRYKVDGFESLSLNEKKMIYYLSQAAISGRDILFDQNGAYNLAVRSLLEEVYTNYQGDRTSAPFLALEKYLKQVWFGNGIYHHYSGDKFVPGFSETEFLEMFHSIDSSSYVRLKGVDISKMLGQLLPVIFNPDVRPKRINQTDGEDLLLTSFSNYYQGVSQKEAEEFYAKMRQPNDTTPVSYGLNSRLVKENGVIKEQTYKIGGLYSPALEKIVFWLEKALSVAENSQQQAVIKKLIEFNKTGDLKAFDEYAILWLQDQNSKIDFVNGFTETYGDPLGLKGSWESLINFKNEQASKRTQTISQNAQWFEDNSPIDPQFKKELVKGVSAKVITAAMLGGDCYPATPIGINLPNSNWIREVYGSKSVTIENITQAYDQAAQGNGFSEEFVYSDTERDLIKKYGFLADNLHTDLHECLGHGSGKLLPGVNPDALKAYGAPMEETRADLFALYYMADPKIVELGLLPDAEAYKAEYYKYLMNGLMTQLTRIEPGKNIEQAHMRNRQTIAAWVLEKGSPSGIVELKKVDGKHYLIINDYKKLRTLFGQLLNHVQRIKSTGDYEGAKTLIETYGVKVNQPLHQEILERYKSLSIAPYKGFVNPVYTPVFDEQGSIKDISIQYDENYTDQMLRYGQEFKTLPLHY